MRASMPLALPASTAAEIDTPRALPTWILRPLVGSIDALIFALAFLSAAAIRLSFDLDRLVEQTILVTGLMLAGLAYHDGYDFRRVQSSHDLLTRLSMGTLVGLGLIVLGSFVLPDLAVGRGIFALHAGLALAPILVWRHRVFRMIRESDLRPRAVVLGEPELAARIATALTEAPYGGAEVLGILTPGRGAAGAPPDSSVPVIGDYRRLGEVVSRYGVSQAYVAAGDRDAQLPLDEILRLRSDSLAVEDGVRAYEMVSGRLLLDKLTPGWIVFSRAFDRTRFEDRLRRALGSLAAAAILALISPFLAAVALVIRLDSPGPVLFRQRRVGLRGGTFDVLKFRTMVRDAEAGTGAVWATERDPRVTRVGRILRATRIDELPQLWNVLRCEMALIGPRPERPEFVAQLRECIPHYDQRHAVRPGITGWAQVHYRYGSTIEDAENKLQFDLYYIQNRSLWLDLEVVLGTIRVVLGATNRN